MPKRPLTSHSGSIGMTVGGDQAHQFNYFSAKAANHASLGNVGVGATANNDYDEEDVE